VVATLSVEVPELFAGGVTEVGFRVQVAFVGQPDETVRLTALLNPFNDVTVMVEFPVLPCATVSDVGLAESEKSGVGAPPQLGNLNEASRVLQSNEAVAM